MVKKLKKIFLISACLALLTGVVFAGFNNNQEVSLNSVGETEKKNTDEGDGKEKIDELYMELTQEKILKEIQPRLEAFGIVDRAKEDEENILEEEVTREEMAKFIIEVLNINEEVEAAKDLNLFTDISADRSSAGYINLAVSKGILKGKDDGTFAPEESVKYVDAITALLKTLGYKEEFLPGKWPASAMVKADSLGITKDVNYESLWGIVDKGSIYILIDNTLKTKALRIVKYNEHDVSIKKPKKETLLKKNFSINQYNGIEILEIKKDVSSQGEVKFKFLTDRYNDKYKAGDIKTFKLSYDADMKELQNFVSQEVIIYVKSDNEVVYIEK